MKKFLRSKWMWVGVGAVVVVGIGAAVVFRKPPQVEYVTEPVKRGAVTQTVTATGKVTSASEVELNFKNPGQLNVVSVKIGDRVTANQVLAQLKGSDLSINVSKARAAYLEAQANLNRVRAGATSQDVAVYEAAVVRAETDVANAQADIETTTKTYTQALNNERNDALVAMTTALTKANITLQHVHNTLNYEGNANNFSVSNLQLLEQVDSGYTRSTAEVDAAKLQVNKARLDSADGVTQSAYEKTLLALNDSKDTIDDLASLLNYVITNSSLTQAELDTLKTTTNSERTSLDSGIGAFNAGYQSYIDARLNLETKVRDANNALSAAQKSLARAQADLQLKKAPARVEDIALYEAQLRRAGADVQYAQDKYEETILRAPIAGVITDVAFAKGEQTSGTEPVVTMLADQEYQIEVDIPESDITKINTGDVASVTLDALTDDYSFKGVVFKGVVTTVNPAQTELQDVVYYKVTVVLSQEQDAATMPFVEKIKPGMTANVSVKTDEIVDALFIPQRAVKDENNRKVVQILSGETPTTIAVELGLRGDGGVVEVRTGLSEGEQVVTFTRQPK